MLPVVVVVDMLETVVDVVLVIVFLCLQCSVVVLSRVFSGASCLLVVLFWTTFVSLFVVLDHFCWDRPCLATAKRWVIEVVHPGPSHRS